MRHQTTHSAAENNANAPEHWDAFYTGKPDLSRQHEAEDLVPTKTLLQSNSALTFQINVIDITWT